ncbi:MAG: hypothetical protein ABIF19_01995 [Planctomycetota bacterium]
MTSEEKKSTGGQKDAAAIEALRRLRESLFSNDISTARLAGFKLSWMQEDGLAILREALFGDYSRTAKKAAAYGLRSMHGRMKELGVEALTQGLNHRDRVTMEACTKALALMKGEVVGKTGSGGKAKSGGHRIKEIPQRRDSKTQRTRHNRPAER